MYKTDVFIFKFYYKIRIKLLMICMEKNVFTEDMIRTTDISTGILADVMQSTVLK